MYSGNGHHSTSVCWSHDCIFGCVEHNFFSQPFFYGVFETRLSTMALCQLLTHCITTGDQVLCSLTIEEEEVATGDGMVTRSQRAAGNTGSVASPSLSLYTTSRPASLHTTKVSLPVKIVRLLVADLQSQLEAECEETQSDSSADGEEDTGCVKRIEALLRSDEEQWEESEDDPDLQDDPLLQLDLQTHLVQYLQELRMVSYFISTIKPHLRPHELQALQSAGVM